MTEQTKNLSAYEPKKLNHHHHAIAEWLVANPDGTLTDCARVHGYSLPWTSRIVASDMFQAYYINLCEERQVISVHGMGTKIAAAGAIAMERLTERLAGSPSDRLLMQATDSLLGKMGFGEKIPVREGDQHLHLHGLTEADLARARLKARDLNSGRLLTASEPEVVN